MKHGAYRSSFVSLVDDADYQALSPLAQAVFHTLKLKLGQYGIAVFYAGALDEIHAKAAPGDIREALAELEHDKPSGGHGWIKREKNVIWMVNGLRFDPFFTADNANNRKGAIAYGRSLPKLAIVDEFLAHYDLVTPSPTPSTPPPQARKSETEPETESGKSSLLTENAVHNRVENPGTDPLVAEATSNDNGELPFHARKFMRTFYSSAPPKRHADVALQVEAMLSDIGAKLDRATRVRAADRDHLDDCCRHVLAEPPRESDKAIVFLLRRVRDTRLEVISARNKTADARPRPERGGPPKRLGEIMGAR